MRPAALGPLDPVAIVAVALLAFARAARNRHPARLDPVGLGDEILRKRHDLNPLPGELLDALQIGALVLRAVSDGHARRAGPPRPSAALPSAGPRDGNGGSSG